MPTIKKGLGKGLGALLGDMTPDENENGKAAVAEPDAPGAEKVAQIKLVDIEPNKEQPRKNFEPEKMEQLAASIGTHGVIQPLLVRPTGNGTYLIVAGERRFRAAKAAGVKTVPCIVKDYQDSEVMEIALIENLQRENLNPVEEAEGYKKLITKFGFTQEQISERVGKSRSAVANALRLNNLPDDIKEMLVDEELSTGHARALLGLQDAKSQIELAERVVAENLNVRQIEAIIADLNKLKTAKKTKSQTNAAMDKYYRDVEKQLSGSFGTKVRIIPGPKKSKIELEYYSQEDLDRILDILNK